MRRAINENPVVQAALIGVMVLAFAFLLFTRVLGGGSEPAEEPAATTPAVGSEAAVGTTTPVTPDTAAVPETAAPETVAPEAGPAPATATGEFVPGKGLPRNVVEAYEDGKVVALLIVRRRGIDDQPVKASVEELELKTDVAVFVTGAKDIARYSQITQGVSVSRTPALVVIRPRNLDEGTPSATVSYGFRGPESVAQAIRDALYKGKKVPYYPE